MVRLSNLPDSATIAAHKGTIDYYTWKGQAVARSWPRYRAYKFSPAQVASMNTFTTVAKATGTIGLEVRALWGAIPTTPGTTWVDFFRNVSMGGDWIRSRG